MRKIALLAAAFVVVGCAQEEAPATDSVATAAAPAAPAALTPADLAGTWAGETKAAGTDSVVNRWTAIRTDDASGKIVMQGATDSIPYTVTYDADSMVATSAPFTDPANPNGPKVTFRSVGRLVDGKLVGTSATMLADRPDSVVSRGNWTATRQP